MKRLPGEKTAFARRHPRAYLGLHGLVGLALAALSAWAFIAVADEVPEQAGMVRLDLAVARWMEAHGTERGEAIFVGISWLGAQVLIAILLAAAVLFVARRDWHHLAVLALTAGGGAPLNAGLKAIFHRARPTYAVEFPVTSWSFPSGHAMDSLIGYGLLAYWIARHFPRHRRATWAVAASLILLIGFARIYLAVHYLSDVVAGFSAGTVWLIVCISGFEFAERSRVGPAGADETPL